MAPTSRIPHDQLTQTVIKAQTASAFQEGARIEREAAANVAWLRVFMEVCPSVCLMDIHTTVEMFDAHAN